MCDVPAVQSRTSEELSKLISLLSSLAVSPQKNNFKSEMALMKIEENELNEWKRTGNRCTDYLHLYTKGHIYDCSFKVGSKETGNNLFKCHKAFLATASPVFEKMLDGHFKEKDMGPDDAITLENVTPTAFDLTMKFVYGNKMDFGDISTFIEVSKFANEMQILALEEEIAKQLKLNASPAEIFAIYDMFKLTGNTWGQKWSWEVIKRNTSEALKSECWTVVSNGTVQDVLNANLLTIDEESELYEALIRWGQNQILLSEKRSPEVTHEVKKTIQEHLKSIRFLNMKASEFSCLDTSHLDTEDKFAILTSLVTKSTACFPKGFSKDLRISTSDSIFFSLTLESVVNNDNHCDFNLLGIRNYPLTFSVSKAAFLVGLQLHESVGKMQFFQLMDEATSFPLGNGNLNETSMHAGRPFYAVPNSCLLAPNKYYRIQFTLDWNQKSTGNMVTLQTEQEIGDNNGMLKIKLPPQSCVHVSEMVFKFVMQIKTPQVSLDPF